MITIDTSGAIALLNEGDPNHGAVVEVFDSDPGPYLIPAGILAEVTYFLERRHGADRLDEFLADLEEGRLEIDCGEGDLPRVRRLVARYADLPLGFADAAVIACAESHGGRVLSLDRRDFDVVAREGTIEVVP